MVNRILGVVFLLFLAGCSSAPSPSVELKTESTLRCQMRDSLKLLFSEPYCENKTVDVLFETNRNVENKSFGIGLSHEVHFGLAKVSVSKRHRVGDIEAGSSKAFSVVDQQELTEDQFKNSLKEVNQWGLLIFVHGFNVKFDEAVFRSSQLTYDLKFQGKSVLWSWPAGNSAGFLEGKLINKTYESNRKNAEDSVEAMANFFKYAVTLGTPLHVLVHSMGHQVVLPALVKVSAELQAPVVDELILNAPDFDAKIFSDVVLDLRKVAKRITLYCSHKDNAILASERFNGGHRMGSCENIPGVDVIDVSDLEDSTFGLGHSYYSSRAILSDVYQVLLGIDAEKRLFIQKNESGASAGFFLRP